MINIFYLTPFGELREEKFTTKKQANFGKMLLESIGCRISSIMEAKNGIF